MAYEYKVVPAPVRGLKAKGVKTPEARFAHALETAMNELAKDGWEYIRADTLPCEQREGIMGKTTVYQNMLVFGRLKDVTEPALAAPIAPEVTAPAPAVDAPSIPDVAEPPLEAPAISDAPTEPAEETKKSSDVAAE